MRQSQQYNIVISGGGSGIGAALAEELSSEGHSVIIFVIVSLAGQGGKYGKQK